MRALDLTNKKFGRLVAIKIYSADKYGRKKWLCVCECGKERVVSSDNLNRGHTISCGCFRDEIRGELSLKHGQNRKGRTSKEYTAWQLMKSRCYNEFTDMYPIYGGRGIVVCDRWLHSFENFFADMGKKPSSEYSLDRYPDTNGNYEPGNCRWATDDQQRRNKRNNHWVTHNGRTLILQDWARELGTTDKVLRGRIKKGIALDKNVNKIIIVDLQTGIFYNSIKEAAIAKGEKYNNLLHKLKGRVKNNTQLSYA